MKTFLEVAEQWLYSKQNNIEESSMARYRDIVFGNLKSAFGLKTMAEITPEILRQYVRSRKAHIAILKQEFAVINMIFCFALNQHKIESNPCDLVSVPRKFRKGISVLRDEDIIKLKEQFSDHPYGAMILFTLYLGLRIGETIGLTWDRVDFETGKVRICQKVDHYYDRDIGRQVRRFVPYTKNKVTREPKMCSQAIELLRALQEKTGRKDGFVFLNPDGSEILYKKFYYEFNKIMKAIGREDVTPHGLRHTAATTILYTTKDLLKLRDYLGHRGTRVTRKDPSASEHELAALAKSMDQKFMPYILQAWGNESC